MHVIVRGFRYYFDIGLTKLHCRASSSTITRVVSHICLRKLFKRMQLLLLKVFILFFLLNWFEKKLFFFFYLKQKYSELNAFLIHYIKYYVFTIIVESIACSELTLGNQFAQFDNFTATPCPAAEVGLLFFCKLFYCFFY
jgi:hypothetical protein